MKLILAFFACLLTTPIMLALATEAKKSKNELNFKAIHHAQIGIDKGVFAILRSGDQIFSIPQFSDYYIQYPYDAMQSKSEQAFQMGERDTAPGKRIRFPEKLGMRFWKGVWQKDGYLWFLDASGPRVITLDTGKTRWSKIRDIVVDLLKPAADSRGEPPKKEIQTFRSQFKKSYKKLTKDLPHVFGWTVLPSKQAKRFSGNHFLLLSRVPNFPLLAMTCKNPQKPDCMIARACQLQLPKGVDQEKLAGIAFSPKRNLLLIGNYSSNEIYLYQANSCYHLPLVKRLKLPKEIHELASLYVDDEDNLWIGSSEPDSYRNASTYRWNSDSW